MMVYATHKNWKEVIDGPNGLQERLDRRKCRERAANKSEFMRRVEELKAEIEAEKQQVRKLETERVGLVERNAAIQTELDHEAAG